VAGLAGFRRLRTSPILVGFGCDAIAV
jgi:hypothetical protein